MDTILYATCKRNEGYSASLELGRDYRVLPDPKAAEHGLIRVVDESGEDYLYPERYFSKGHPPRRNVWRWVALGGLRAFYAVTLYRLWRLARERVKW